MCAFKTSLVSYSSALQKCFLKYTFIVLVAICSDFGNQSNKICHGFHCFAIYLPWIDGTRFHDLHFLNVEFLANFFTLTFIKRLFSSSLSAIRVYTWTSTNGQHRNQIDYILCSQRWRSSIQSAKTRPGADCGSDHELLVAKFRHKLKKVGKTTRPFR